MRRDDPDSDTNVGNTMVCSRIRSPYRVRLLASSSIWVLTHRARSKSQSGGGMGRPTLGTRRLYPCGVGVLRTNCTTCPSMCVYVLHSQPSKSYDLTAASQIHRHQRTGCTQTGPQPRSASLCRSGRGRFVATSHLPSPVHHTNVTPCSPSSTAIRRTLRLMWTSRAT